MAKLGKDWTPGSNTKEQHENPEEGTYEAVIAEVPFFYKDVTWEGVTERKARTTVVHELDCVDSNGVRFQVSTKNGAPSLSKQSNLFKYMDKLDLGPADVKGTSGINGLLVGKGVKVTVEHSKPIGEEGIIYTNFVTHKASDNGMTVSENYVAWAERFPESQIAEAADNDTPF
jgi:hypothetical protein